MNLLIPIIGILLLFGCQLAESNATAQSENTVITASTQDDNFDGQFKVIGIKDGDTYVLLVDGSEQTVRLAHIDCPEKKQAFGTKAKQFASDICFGKNVSVVFNPKNKFDRNKRLIAEVILADGTNVNKELVKNGLAWHFKKYSDDSAYAQLELQAQEQKIGLWSEANPIAPWDWRRPKQNTK